MVIDFYLDFISPYVYLARGRLIDIASRQGCGIAYHPVAIMSLREQVGSTGPSNSQIPAKMAYFAKDYRRWAEYYGLPIAETLAGFDTGELNRGLLLAVDRGEADLYAQLASDCVWRDGKDPAAAASLASIEAEMGWEAGILSDFASSPEAQARYDAETKAASECGVFGVPSFIIGDEMWWGNDRLDFLECHLEAT